MHAEVVIVGGGPAGLSAALLLGRCVRHVLVFDNGVYRNDGAHELRGFLTRDAGTSPDDLRALARRDLERYTTVRLRHDSVVDARVTKTGFAVLTSAGEQIDCAALLLATGFRDKLPAIGGARELHGERVVPSPYYDAFEVRGQPLAAFATPDENGASFARMLAQWSGDVIFCAERRPVLSDRTREQLAARGVRVEQRELRSVERDGEGLRLLFSEGSSVWRRKLFYQLGGEPTSNLAARLGATLDDRGSVIVSRGQATSIPGLFVAGDATRDVLQAIVAAGEGSSAAVAINAHLCSNKE